MYSQLANPRATRETLERFDLVTRHRLGQNFLVSDGVVGRILALAELDDADVVYEVGPGIGTLTVALLDRAGAVVAVEADRRLPPVLAQTCAARGDRLALVEGDALRVEPGELRAAVASLGRADLCASPTKLVANLPYQVAATVLLRAFERLEGVRRAVVMVQAEVADRIAARPGTKAYGAYTVKLALRARVSGRFEVAPGSFLPPPHVGSAVVRLDREPASDPTTGAPLAPADVDWVARVVDGAFAQRRKTLRNALVASGFGREPLDEALAVTGVDAGERAERLDPAAFVRLALALRGA